MQPPDPEPSSGVPAPVPPVAAEGPADADPALGRHELQSLTLAPVASVGLRPLHAVAAATDVVAVVRLFRGPWVVVSRRLIVPVRWQRNCVHWRRRDET